MTSTSISSKCVHCSPANPFFIENRSIIIQLRCVTVDEPIDLNRRLRLTHCGFKRAKTRGDVMAKNLRVVYVRDEFINGEANNSQSFACNSFVCFFDGKNFQGRLSVSLAVCFLRILFSCFWHAATCNNSPLLLPLPVDLTALVLLEKSFEIAAVAMRSRVNCLWTACETKALDTLRPRI
jgi:hypothetical protein